MWLKNIFIIVLFSIFISEFAIGQQIPAGKDSTHIHKSDKSNQDAPQINAKKDSTHLYKDIESISKKRKFTKFMYALIFRPIAPNPSKKKDKKKIYKKLIQKPYSAFEGKTIRHINIETLDPFGNSIGDTIVATGNIVSKTGNNLHIKTLPITIRNLLLIRQNQPFDSLLVKESERLVRTRVYIRDVSFFVKPTAKNSDSVDIYIRALDTWSMIPGGAASTSAVTVNLTDQNFLGLGHEFQNTYTRNYDKESNSFVTNYAIPNIRNTYISTTLHFNILGTENYTRSLSIDRPFFSPFAKWAAGFLVTQQYHQDSIRLSNTFFVQQRIKFNVQDFWVGNAIKLYSGNTEYTRTTNFISAVRFLRIRYLEKPTEIVDPQFMFSDEDLYLASIGISARNYRQDKYIFKFGVTEDVPMGKVFSMTGGYQVRNDISRFYIGARVSSGYYYSWGYLGSNFEFGTFFKGSEAQQGVINVSVNYFTGLLEIGKWKFRQFVKPQATLGIKRFAYDSLTINQGFGLDGFNSLGLRGTRRILLTLQTQSYAPWNFIGFKFGPFLTCSMAMLGDDSTGFNHSKMYYQFGLGVLIKNENLILNAFQISIAFFPSIPNRGDNVFKTNSFKTTDFGFKDFEIGKPGIALYQ